MGASRIVWVLLFMVFEFQSCESDAGPWIKAGYWYVDSESPIPDINSALFTHLICAFANVNSSSYHLSISSSDEQYFSSFSSVVRRKNPSVVTLLSVWDGQEATSRSILGEKLNTSVLSLMVSQPSYRKSFIESSIRTARLYDFDGVDLFWLYPNTDSDMKSLGILLREWQAAVSSSESKLILSMAVHYLPTFGSVTYPIGSMLSNLDWAHVMAYDYHLPVKENFTGAHAALFDPSSNVSTDFGIRQWVGKGFPVSNLVLGLPYHGYAWTLVNPKNDAIGAPGRLALTKDGSMSYKYIKWYIRSYGVETMYNASYVVNYCTVGLNWIGFDDVEAIRAKVAYAKEKRLLGYNVFMVTNDDDWALSRAAAQEEGKDGENRRRILLIVLLPIALVIILLCSLTCYLRSTVFKSRGQVLRSELGSSLSTGNLEGDGSFVHFFSFAEIMAATDNFSSENKLGEGGYGPVYKGVLQGGQEIAVKRLSKTSTQGLEEFKNEVMLTARLQHVNLLRVTGFCTEGEEKMLIYEYMPNRSLDFYLFEEPVSQYILDWRRRVHIVEGITQGLLYLQEYSNITIIHRDLKASNILLDSEMNPKISDFGIARLFCKDELEASTGHIVGTYGYAPPEYVKKGIYSMKYDVYSFGVLLLQIISGKRNACCYGPNRNLSLLEHAYDLWIDGRGMEFIDPLLDDTYVPCKLMTCMQIALLCVQENPVDRPTMLEVYSALFKNVITSITTPKTPAFSVKCDETSTTQQDICSVNDATMSQVIPR